MRTVFPLIIALISIAGGYNSVVDFTTNSFLALVVSTIGILGAYFYHKGSKFSNTLLYIWVIAQIPEFYKITTVSADDSIITSQIRTKILSLYQFFKFSLGFTFRSASSTNYFHINLLAFVYFPIIHWLELEKSVGNNFDILSFHEFETETSYKAEITKRVTVNGEKDWYIINLDKAIEFDDYSTNNFMITPQEGNNLLLQEDKTESIKSFACPPQLSLNQSRYSYQDIEYAGLIDVVLSKK